jgi:hypothetical protein
VLTSCLAGKLGDSLKVRIWEGWEISPDFTLVRVMIRRSRHPRQPGSQWIWIGLALLLVIPVGLEAFGFWPYDPVSVIRGTSETVPDFSDLSEDETIAALQQIITRRGDGRWYVRSLELRGEGQLKLVKATTGNFTQTVWVPLAELDTFLYADIFKGQEPWGIEVFCAHRVDCLRLESVNDGELTRRADNNDSWFFAAYSAADARQALGLFNRLLELNNAPSTIDTGPSVTYIQRRYEG